MIGVRLAASLAHVTKVPLSPRLSIRISPYIHRSTVSLRPLFALVESS